METTSIPDASNTSSKEYNRWKYLLTVISFLINVSYLVLMALYVSIPLRERVLVVSNSYYLQVAFYYTGFFWLYLIINLPLEFYSGFLLERRYGLSQQGLGEWAKQQLKEIALIFGLSLFMVEVLYFILYNFPAYWWPIAGLTFILVSIVMARLFPVLILPIFYKSTPVEDESLKGLLLPMAREAGLDLKGIFRINLSKDTRKVNALLAGLGKTRRVIFSDTLLESFTPEEVQIVFAHEIGHHVYRHIPKLLFLSSLTIFVGLAIVDSLLRKILPMLNLKELYDPATFPVFLLIMGTFALVLLPLENAYSRYLERQCDMYAIDKTKNPQAFISTMEKLADKNLADKEPSNLIEYLFYDHPPISKRIKIARQRLEATS